MTIVWPSFWAGLGFTLVAIVVFAAVAAALYALVLRATDKNLGLDGCLVCNDGFKCEIGQYTRLGVWFRSRRHNWLIRPKRWHREAWARNRWNPYRLPGFPTDRGTAAERKPRPNAMVRAYWAVMH